MRSSETAVRHVSRGAFVAGVSATAAICAHGGTVSAATDIRRTLRIDPRHSGAGKTYDVGVLVPLTGPGAIYGSHGTDIFKLAARDIQTLGGPKLNMIYKDNKSGDPQAGVTAMREFGEAGVPMMLQSYVADLGAALPGIAQYKIFSIDGTGGTNIFAQNKPYFWGAIATSPNDAFAGALKFVAKKLPAVKKVAFVGWDLGPLSDVVAKNLEISLGAEKFTRVADERTAVGATDYSATIQKVKAAAPDMIFLAIYTDDVGYFLKQYATSGIDKPVMAFTHSAAAAAIAGAAYDGLYFAFDFFDAQRPSNAFARYFVDSFKAAEGGTLPEYYAANFYEDAFVLWACIRRVLASGGNPNDGTQLDAALRSKPVFPSVYGGNDSEPGELAFDLQTHSVRRRPMMVSQYRSGNVTPLAFFNIGGTDFRLA